MSNYYNTFSDGSSDKPKKKKSTRTKHSTWRDIMGTGGAGKGSLAKARKKALDKKIKKAGG